MVLVLLRRLIARAFGPYTAYPELAAEAVRESIREDGYALVSELTRVEVNYWLPARLAPAVPFVLDNGRYDNENGPGERTGPVSVGSGI